VLHKNVRTVKRGRIGLLVFFVFRFKVADSVLALNALRREASPEHLPIRYRPPIIVVDLAKDPSRMGSLARSTTHYFFSVRSWIRTRRKATRSL
jgi:hypothetical protein